MVAGRIDKSKFFVMLLEPCNFSCRHCAWIDGRIETKSATHPGYKLSFAQIKTLLADARKISGLQRIHFSGGEPTLWTDGGADFVDLLIEVANAGIEPSFISNGSSFARYDRCRGFFEKYFSCADKCLHVTLSIDTFHKNFNPKRARARCLDNFIKYRSALPDEKAGLLDVEVFVAISKDPGSLLPEDMVSHYRSQGIEIRFGPVRLHGKAKAISHLCPDLESGTPEGLGAFHRFYKGFEEPRFNWVSLWGTEYHIFGRKFAELGHLDESIIDAQANHGG